MKMKIDVLSIGEILYRIFKVRFGFILFLLLMIFQSIALFTTRAAPLQNYSDFL